MVYQQRNPKQALYHLELSLDTLLYRVVGSDVNETLSTNALDHDLVIQKLVNRIPQFLLLDDEKVHGIVLNLPLGMGIIQLRRS